MSPGSPASYQATGEAWPVHEALVRDWVTITGSVIACLALVMLGTVLVTLSAESEVRPRIGALLGAGCIALAACAAALAWSTTG